MPYRRINSNLQYITTNQVQLNSKHLHIRERTLASEVCSGRRVPMGTRFAGRIGHVWLRNSQADAYGPLNCFADTNPDLGYGPLGIPEAHN